jgi:hypothetical protein
MGESSGGSASKASPNLGTRLTAGESVAVSLLTPSEAAPVPGLRGPWVLQAVITTKTAHPTKLAIARFALVPAAGEINGLGVIGSKVLVSAEVWGIEFVF